ncbi:MAG TPA: type II secretion system secretin GspD [Kofleriaceae bacterium]|nr:type II secretion system secretin GspD [Kofleriaceae bacterium]
MRATAALVIVLAAGVAEAKEKSANTTAEALGALDAAPPGEDDELYRCGKATADVAVTFKPGTELADLVAWAMSFTCKNFVYSSRVVAGRTLTVTVVAPSRMSPAEAWRLFLVALHGMNLTVVAKGKVLEVVELPQARRHAVPIVRPGAAGPAGEQVVRVLFRPARIPVDDLAAALRPLASADGEIVPLARAGLLVVTDTGAHLSRMRELVEEIDQGGPEAGVYTVPLARARAADIASLLRELLAGDGPAAAAPPTGKEAPPSGEAAPLRILVDERTNALVLLATRAAYARARALVERLDVEVDGGGGGSAHILALRHGDAVKMAETLNAMLSGAAAAAGSDAPRPSRPAGKADPTSGAVQGQVRVTADALSNSLLVWAGTRDFVAVREIVRQLDAPRPQVFIEAMIVEVTSGQTRDIGVAWHGGRVSRRGDLWFGGLASDSLNSVSFARAAENGELAWSGFLGGVMGVPIPGVEKLLGTSIPSFTVLFQALAENDHVDILSSPTLMTTDNMKATLAVGQNVAYKAGVKGVSATPGLALEEIQRDKVGLTLDVTPHVGAGGQVRLDLEITIQDIIGQDELGPTWSERKVTNTVVVGDADTAVIGGLVGRKKRKVTSKIPLLGDLPVLGHLFKSSHAEERKTNLVILLTPYVLADPLDRARSVDRALARRTEVLGALERLDAMEHRPRPDGTRLRGLVAEIDRKVREVEAQKALLDSLDLSPDVPSGPVE